MKRPSPVPGFAPPGTSARPNFSKISRCWSCGIPGPWSATRDPHGAVLRLRRCTSTSSPDGEYLTALSIRFVSTWRSRSRSPRIERHAPCDRRAHAHLVLADARRRDRVLDEPREIDVGEAVGERAGLDARRVEHVADERGEPVRLVGDQREERLALAGGERAPAFLQRARGADHGGHRAPQLVRDERDEVGAQRREPPQLLDRLPLGLVGADVLDRGRDEAAEQRDELDLLGRERVGLDARERDHPDRRGRRAGAARRARCAGRARAELSSSGYSVSARSRRTTTSPASTRSSTEPRSGPDVPGGNTVVRAAARGRDRPRARRPRRARSPCARTARARAPRG